MATVVVVEMAFSTVSRALRMVAMPMPAAMSTTARATSTPRVVLVLSVHDDFGGGGVEVVHGRQR